MVDLGTSSSLEFVNSWKNDYNMDTNLPFVYQLALPKYHELVEDWDGENNYKPNIPKWANTNYLKTFAYECFGPQKQWN